MERTVKYKGIDITYDLTIKNVKNINLRVRTNGSVAVSANRYVSEAKIDSFVFENAQFILNAQEKHKRQEDTHQEIQFDESEFLRIFNEVEAEFKSAYNIPHPQLKLKTLKSKWGSCDYQKNIIVINKGLMYYPISCTYYVMVHEFAHFIVHNHSKDFYKVVEAFMPDYKKYRKMIKE